MAPSEGPQELDLLVTEARGSADDYDRRSTQELVELMNAGDLAVPAVVGAAAGPIAAAIDAIVERLERGGRLVYAGAGSSGRIAALDADECEATFSTKPGQVVALVAGGALASPFEQERAEDDAAAGRRAVAALEVSATDAVIGVSASGRTPRSCSARWRRRARRGIQVVVGPEFVAGSTRLKAGTAQKLVLNTISTVSMIRLGRTFGDLMVDVRASNEKLEARARRIVSLATGASAEGAERALAAAGGSAKVAIVSLLAGVEAETARTRLDEAKGDIRSALRR